MSELSGAQFKQLEAAIVHAFTLSELKRFTRYELNENLEAVAVGNAREVTFELIDWADKEGRLDELINGLQATKPNNPRIKAFQNRYRSSLQTDVTHQQLEKIVSKNQTIKNPRKWRNTMEEQERRVCRIEIDGEAKGTGFLVAPRVVMTCQHVVSTVEAGHKSPTKIVCRFDYQLGLDEPIPDAGQTYTLGDAWLIDSSPPDDVDESPMPKAYEPDANHLDYALLRLAEAAGDEALASGPRGFVALPNAIPELEVDGAVAILQHPAGATLGYAYADPSITEVNPGRTRVRHRTNTKGGSSGSPCFDSDWNLIALHHSGDPAKIKPAFNEGIPIATIRDNLPAEAKQETHW